MTTTRPLSTAAKLNAGFLFAAALGIVLQIIVGVPGYPVVPPGPIILAVAGILVLTLSPRYRWITIVGVVAPAFILVGGILEGSIWGRLGAPGDFGPFFGTAVQMIGVALAVVYGIIAVAHATSPGRRTMAGR